jgi:hypothetical protein
LPRTVGLIHAYLHLVLIKDGQTWKRGLFLREPLNPHVQVFCQTLVSDDQSCLDNAAQ